jgi:phosphopantothenate-cysteine ligase
MEVIVTSGGTIARIDDVRHIGNFSEGTTGALIAEEFLRRGALVHYVYNKRARRPFRARLVIDPGRPLEDQLARVKDAYLTFQQNAGRLREHPFETFDEYLETVRGLLTNRTADVIVLAAAVSDYGATPLPGKMSSEEETLRIDLVKNPKVISLVKQWHPHVFQVGFKLLVNAHLDELVEVAYRHGLKNRSDLTVANTVLAGDFARRVTVLITPEKGLTPVSVAELPARLAEMVQQRFSKKHYRTEVSSDTRFRSTLADHIDRFRATVKRLWQLALFEPYHEGASRHFGFLAQRTPGGGFLITARGSNKETMPVEDIVHVANIDFAHRLIRVSGRKASLNANIAGKVFADRPEVQVILHAHVFPGVGPRTEVARTPGTDEDLEEALECLGSGRVVELVNHGIIAVGREIGEILTDLEVEPAYTRFADVYDLMYHRFQQSDDFLRLVEKTVGRDQAVLDLAGGTGELAGRLLGRGYRRVAVADRHEAMLAVARRRLADVPCDRVDMRDLHLSGSFDAILVRQAINYLMNQDGLVAGLKGIRRFLNDRGVLIFNAPNHRVGREYPGRQLLHEAGGYLVGVREMNLVEGTMMVHAQNCVLYRQDGMEIRRLYDCNRFGLFTRQELERAAAEAGFGSVEFHGKGLGEWTVDSRSLYAVARK